MERSTILRFKKVVAIHHYTKVSVILMKLDHIVQSKGRHNFKYMLNKISQIKSILRTDLVELRPWVLASRNGSQSLILD